jgi:hypothetical protein
MPENGGDHMRAMILLALVLAVWAPPGSAAPAGDHGVWRFVAGPSLVVPFPYARRPIRLPAPAQYGAYVDSGYDGVRLPPWRYDPDPSCVAPNCLPSYYRPVYPLPAVVGPLLPVAAVLKRLKGLDYQGFGPVARAGANYHIDALNRFGQPVRLIVNAGNGQIRTILP